MDIRKFFSPVNKKAPQVTQEKKCKKIIESDDEEDPLPSRSRKHKVLESDSDDDIFEVVPKAKRSHKLDKRDTTKPDTQSASVSKPQPLPPTKPTSTLKPVSVNDYFGSKSSSQSQHKVTKTKVENVCCEGDAEDPFERTLRHLDATRAPKKERRGGKSRRSAEQRESSSQGKLANGVPNPSSKLSQKMKADATYTETLPREGDVPVSLKKRGRHVISHNEETLSPKKRSKMATPDKEPTSGKKTSSVATTHQGPHPPNQGAEAPDLDEQKKQRAMAYRKFLQRVGPRNPGGKPLPEGAPNCLSGLTFVLTGVLETIDREETTQLIQKYGGKVTTNVSRNTSFLVVGEDPGQSKTKKAEQLGKSLLDENELFKLIQTRPSKEGVTPLHKTKVKDEEDKVKLSQFCVNSPKPTSSFPLSPAEQGTPASTTSGSSSNLSSPASLTRSRPVTSQEGSLSSFSASSPSCEKGSSQGTEPPSSQEVASRGPADSFLWVDKYRPAFLKNIIGQQGEQSNAKKLLRWLQNWDSNHSGNKKRGPAPSPWAKDNTGAYFKAALLSGPPGVGKTTTAHVVCQELGLDVVELNASDTRSKRALSDEVSELLSSTTLAGFAVGCRESGGSTSRKRALVMDEVDGMAGNEDRGGVQELIALIKGTRTPIICLCNDRSHPKMRSLANHCFDLRFQRPRIEQIRGAMMTVCFREGIKIRPEALDQVIVGSNRDVRQVLHHLSLWSAAEVDLDSETVKKDANLAKKDLKMGPWDVCTQVFSASARRQMTIHDKVSLFFHDYSIGPLFVHENYLKVSPDSARGNRAMLLSQVAKTAHVLADSDIIEKSIRRDSAWSLLPTQAIFSSVCPGEYMSGHFSAQVEFPNWLGKNSSRNKFDRIAQEIQTHTRLKISGNKRDVIMDYSPMLRDSVVCPLAQRGLEGVKEAVEAMTAYNLLREDWDAVVELSTWPGRKDPRTAVEGKVKAAFTRTFNKETRPTPFAITPAPRRTTGNNPLMGAYEDASDDDGVDSDEDDDLSKDVMVKPGKLSLKEDAKKADSSSSKGKRKGGRGAKK